MPTTNHLVNAADLDGGGEVVTNADSDGGLVFAVDTRRQILLEKLQAFDPVRHGGEAMAFEPLGSERIK